MSVYKLMVKNLTMFILINSSNIDQLSKFMYLVLGFDDGYGSINLRHKAMSF